MSQVASLNGAERAFGFGPPAQAARRGRAPAGLIAAAAFAAVLVLLPILVTVVQAAGVSAQGAVDLLMRPLVGRLLVNTVGLVVAASATCAVIGTATAWLVERTDLPGRKVWAVLAVAPLAIPPFISSYAWVSLSNGLQDFGGALLVVTCAYYPLVYLPVAAALRGLDPGLEETARSLGHGAWGCFFRVVAPQLRPALYGGVLLVALDVLIEFGAFALLRFRTFTTELYAQYRTGLDGPESSVLALVLIALCLICVVGELSMRGRARYARVGSGARRIAAPVQPRVDPAAGAAGVRGADDGDAWRALGHDRLLADAARSGRHLAGRAIAGRLSSTRRSLPSVMDWPEPPRPWCLRRRSLTSRRATRAACRSLSSGSPISRRACRPSSSRWRSFR